MFIYPKNEWKIIFDIIKRNCWIVNWLEKLKFCQFEVTGVLSIHRTQKFTWSPLFHQSCSKVTILFANKFPVRWTSRQGKTIVVHAYLHFFLNIYEENFYYSIRIRGCNFNCENWVCPINFELAKKESHKVQVKKTSTEKDAFDCHAYRVIRLKLIHYRIAFFYDKMTFPSPYLSALDFWDSLLEILSLINWIECFKADIV